MSSPLSATAWDPPNGNGCLFLTNWATSPRAASLLALVTGSDDSPRGQKECLTTPDFESEDRRSATDAPKPRTDELASFAWCEIETDDRFETRGCFTGLGACTAKT